MVRSKSWCGIGLVPKMTSATTPSGEVVCKSVDSTYPAYLAFDGDVNTAGRAHNTGVTSSAYIGYIFAEPTVVKSIYYKSATSASNTVSVQGYDGSNWTDIKTNVTITSSAEGYITFDNSIAYQGYRLYQTNASTANAFNFYVLQFYASNVDANITEDSTAMSYIGLNNYCSNTLLADSDWLNAICNSAYFESVLNVKVPTMTSDTTPSGTCFGSTTYTGSYEYWRAFRNVFDGKGGGGNCWQSANNSTSNQYIGYEFSSAVVIKAVSICNTNYANERVNTFKVEVEEEGSWTPITDTLTNGSSASATSNFGILNSSSHTKYRLYILTNGGGSVISANTIQFYGRQDV